jgi:hypothetical protein
MSRPIGADESIKEAQARLRKQDAEMTAYVDSILARFRKGEYVDQEELDFAFQQMERRYSK